MENPPSENTKVSFDEFKLFYESTEKVTDRRLAANTWNYSICIAILVSIAAVVKWSTGNPLFFYVGLTAVFLLCGMAILFSSLWLGQIEDFKHLNNAKFGVLNDMAPRIEFHIDHPEQISSFCPFEKEWLALEKVKAAVGIRRSRIVALKSSNIEYFIPSAFRVLFFSIGLVVLVGVILRFGAFVNSWRAILHIQ